MSRLVVCGTGRCGTRHVARALTAAGVRCGHEDVFTTGTVTAGGPFAWGDWQADVSWRAMPVLPLADVELVHLVRHPLDVIASMAAVGFHDDPAVRAVVEIACPAVYRHDDPIARAAHHWLVWNGRLAHLTDRRVLIESGDLTPVFDAAGVAAPDVTIPTDDNGWRTKTKTWTAVKWGDLPPAMADTARAVAARLGYPEDA